MPNDEPTASWQHSARVKHPAGLITLVLIEMWERMSYYGLRTVLVLFLVAPATAGGFGMKDKSAALVYGLVVSLFTFLGMFAGWLGDNVLGSQRSIVIGGATIIAGLVAMVLTAAGILPVWAFFLGLWIDVLGIALLKTNVPALLAELYIGGPANRDAGFFYYYMGINVGTLLGTAAVPLIAAAFGWAWGFGVSLLGMAIGLAQFLTMRHRFGGVGVGPCGTLTVTGRKRAAGGALAIVSLVTAAIATSVALGSLDIAGLAHLVSGSYILLALGFMAYLLFTYRHDPESCKRVLAMVPIGLGAALFVIGFDQAGSSLNLFALRFTDRTIGNFEVPAGLFQSAYPIGIILLAPLFTVIWARFDTRGRQPTVLSKFGAGLMFMATGFLVMYFAARSAEANGTAMPTWLLGTYLLHTLGDLCVGAVGISASTKIAPRRSIAQFVGLWYVGLAIGHNLSGYVAAGMDTSSLPGMARGFYNIFILGMIGAGIVLVLSPIVRRMLGPKIEF
jgi:POT family proton-dependent oligopeptide transporter